MKDWNDDFTKPDSDITRYYHGEIDHALRNILYPDGSVHEICQRIAICKRGKGANVGFYGEGVHQDYALTPDDYQDTVHAYSDESIGQAWRDKFEQDQVSAFGVVCFWRPINL